MKIIFICGCLEPGRDGVGDYTRELAGELIQQGHQTAAVALNDRQITEELKGVQMVNGVSLPVLRLPAVWSDKKRYERAKAWISQLDPEWLSLQFVPFSFNLKGLTFGLGSFLQALGSRCKWHLMFHEPWVEATAGSAVKQQFLKIMQVYLIKGMVQRLKPVVINTSNQLYKKLLRQENIAASVLPLPSNIPVSDKGLARLHAEFAELGLNEQTRDGWCVLGAFGRLRPQVNLRLLLHRMLMEMNQQKRRLAFFSMGRTGASGKEVLEALALEFKDNILIHEFGERSPEEVSAFFQLLDYGVACVPRDLLGKSGAVSAMKLHGLEVLAPADMYDENFAKQVQAMAAVGCKVQAMEFSPANIAIQLTEELSQNSMSLLEI